MALPCVEEALHLLDGVAEAGAGADGGAAHGDAARGDEGEVEGEAVLVEEHAVLDDELGDDLDDLEHAQAADDAGEGHDGLGVGVDHLAEDEAVDDDGDEDDGEVDELEGAAEEDGAEAVDADARLVGEDEEDDARGHLRRARGSVFWTSRF